ncbi:MAG: DNA base-flipping protein YbaZ [Gammaproteobacteria bacterium HGW-Gammaproteobacteria-11]|nr:MAG: DNA base-flipping protein YbaZ [Gammaproteobacteria bacterium HGW-Gammaproteobacteria-11]
MTDQPIPANADMRQANPPAKERFWLVLASIPEGRVTSYGVLAKLAGMGRGARLAGRWLGQLPPDTSLPWHRVLASTGYLSLPENSPSGREQYRRLRAEGVIIQGHRVDMKRFAWPDRMNQQETHD